VWVVHWQEFVSWFIRIVCMVKFRKKYAKFASIFMTERKEGGDLKVTFLRHSAWACEGALTSVEPPRFNYSWHVLHPLGWAVIFLKLTKGVKPCCLGWPSYVETSRWLLWVTWPVLQNLHLCLCIESLLFQTLLSWRCTRTTHWHRTLCVGGWVEVTERVSCWDRDFSPTVWSWSLCFLYTSLS
jgi:hypothetical protein